MNKEELFKLILKDPSHTLVVGFCSDIPSGCTEFGRQFADTLKTDYLRSTTMLTEQHPLRYNPKKNYHCIVVCGCAIADAIVFKLMKQLNPSNKVGLVVGLMSPPHLTCQSTEQNMRNMTWKIKSLTEQGYISCLLGGGFGAGPTYDIGLPPMLPATTSVMALPIPEKLLNAKGLLYLTHLDLGEELYQPWFSRFFQQLRRKHPADLTVRCVLIAGAGAHRAEDLVATAQQHGVALQIGGKLPQPQFITLLKKIGQHNGLVGCNGSITAIQCAQLRIPLRVLISSLYNMDFYQQWHKQLPAQFDLASRHILNIALTAPTEEELQALLRQESAIMQALHNSLARWFSTFVKLCRNNTATAIANSEAPGAIKYLHQVNSRDDDQATDDDLDVDDNDDQDQINGKDKLSPQRRSRQQ